MTGKRIKKNIKEIYPYVLVIIAVILIRTYIITPAMVDGESMLPNLQDNNVLILNKLDYKLNDIKRFDIIVVDYNGEKLIKRVIGLPGEYVEYKDEMLFIDGYNTTENFRHGITNDFKLEKIGYITIPGDKYFVVGDNRQNSKDSRMIGLIDKKDILGSTTYRLFPITKIGKIK